MPAASSRRRPVARSVRHARCIPTRAGLLRRRRADAGGAARRRAWPRSPAWCRRSAALPPGCAFAPRCPRRRATLPRASAPALTRRRAPGRRVGLLRCCEGPPGVSRCSPSTRPRMSRFARRRGTRARGRRRQLRRRARRDAWAWSANPAAASPRSARRSCASCRSADGAIVLDGTDISRLERGGHARRIAPHADDLPGPVRLAQSAPDGRPARSPSR